MKSPIRMTKNELVAAQNQQLTPAQSAKLRSQIALHVEKQIVEANNVVMKIDGATWTPTQARVFGMLLNKVIPDLNASFVQHEHKTSDLTQMTRDELERLAVEVQTIEGQSEDITPEEGDTPDDVN